MVRACFARLGLVRCVPGGCWSCARKRLDALCGFAMRASRAARVLRTPCMCWMRTFLRAERAHFHRFRGVSVMWLGSFLLNSAQRKTPSLEGRRFRIKPLAMTYSCIASYTTIGAAAFHFRVRDGIGWYHSAIVARERVRTALWERRSGISCKRVTNVLK